MSSENASKYPSSGEFQCGSHCRSWLVARCQKRINFWWQLLPTYYSLPPCWSSPNLNQLFNVKVPGRAWMWTFKHISKYISLPNLSNKSCKLIWNLIVIIYESKKNIMTVSTYYCWWVWWQLRNFLSFQLLTVKVSLFKAACCLVSEDPSSERNKSWHSPLVKSAQKQHIKYIWLGCETKTETNKIVKNMVNRAAFKAYTVGRVENGKILNKGYFLLAEMCEK